MLFDLDGVLIDSRVAIVRCIQHGLRENGAPVPPAAELERFIGPPLIDAFAELAGPERVGALPGRLPRALRAGRASRRPRSCRARAEALAAVAARVPVAVATTKPRAFAEPLCERLGLAPSLTAVVRPGARRAARRSRPSRSAARSRRSALAPGADAPLVGDRSHDAEAARANGIRCVGVLWGIGDEAELRAAGADPIVASPRDFRPRSGSREPRLGQGAVAGGGQLMSAHSPEVITSGRSRP